MIFKDIQVLRSAAVSLRQLRKQIQIQAADHKSRNDALLKEITSITNQLRNITSITYRQTVRKTVDRIDSQISVLTDLAPIAGQTFTDYDQHLHLQRLVFKMNVSIFLRILFYFSYSKLKPHDCPSVWYRFGEFQRITENNSWLLQMMCHLRFKYSSLNVQFSKKIKKHRFLHRKRASHLTLFYKRLIINYTFDSITVNHLDHFIYFDNVF